MKDTRLREPLRFKPHFQRAAEASQCMTESEFLKMDPERLLHEAVKVKGNFQFQRILTPSSTLWGYYKCMCIYIHAGKTHKKATLKKKNLFLGSSFTCLGIKNTGLERLDYNAIIFL